MKKKLWVMIPAYCLVFLGLIITALVLNKSSEVMKYNEPLRNRHCFIIDAGHGGIDGGAVSCTGAYESHINLEISLRLNDLMNLLGYDTKMIRTEDISIYVQGETISGKKSSDLKERVRIVNETENGILLSIHQNHYTDSYYSGAQMFYPNTEGSENLAKQLQAAFVTHLNPGSNRKEKPVEGLYLMKHVQKTSVLIECGFISNYEEEAKLKSPSYQKKICCVIGAVCAKYCTDSDPLNWIDEI